MATINIKLDFLICETSINTFLCKFYYWDNSNSRIMPWTAQQSNKQDALALMQTYSNDLYTALLNIEGITPLGGGSVTDYGTYSEMSFDIVVETGSQSQDIDYTQILTSINSNLASIASKNNQSDIVSCLQDIFMYTASDTNNKVSAMKCENVSVHNETYLKTVNVIYQMRKLVNCFSSLDRDFNQSVDNNSKVLSQIDSRLFFSQGPYTFTIANMLPKILSTLSSGTLLNPNNNLFTGSLLKDISDKLANSNDLHTISQAIDLISTAIAQTNNTLSTANTDLGNIATNINSIQSNPLIEVNIDVPYEVKNLTKKDTEY